jgi:hypothetical protein
VNRTFLLVALLVTGDAAADTYFVEPASPLNTDLVSARVVREGCRFLPATVVPKFEGNRIRIELPFDDFCETNVPLHERTYPVGHLPRGPFVLEFWNCGETLLNGYRCSLQQQLPFVVGGAAPAPVPAIGNAGKAGAIVTLILLAFARSRRRAELNRTE